MSQQNVNGIITLVAANALEAWRRVKLDASGEADYAGAGEPAVAITQAKCAAGDQVACRLLNSPGTFKMTASGAIAIRTPVYGTASGKIDDSAAANPGSPIGIPLEAASADGDVIEVMPLPSAQGVRTVSGQQTTVAAADTVATGLAKVLGVVASLDSDPTDDPEWASATIGDQAGAPAAGSIILKTWKNTAGNDPTPTAAATFGKKVNWLAWGY